MSDDRNLTAHTYNEDLAEQVSARVTTYYKIICDVIRKRQIDKAL